MDFLKFSWVKKHSLDEYILISSESTRSKIELDGYTVWTMHKPFHFGIEFSFVILNSDKKTLKVITHIEPSPGRIQKWRNNVEFDFYWMKMKIINAYWYLSYFGEE